ncbi:hypothetical protein KOAAANKH_02537 [Brevundimonas sp. NIBR10]|uniref:hypothetical protein n=1 Tax=Brevundimonas sp. NIBR10 TaxID=3015997 RepID=UPI0027A8A2D1|nr:hypothetical protein KOAAANKH_02537 [Brevundimonas sp. NIBR10]
MTTEATSLNDAAPAEAQITGAATEGTASEAVVTGAETAAPAAQAETTGHVRPEGLPDEFWDDATGLKAGDLAVAYRDMKAANEARLADVPAADASYDLALPADFVVPEGFAVEIKADDPLWADFQSIAKDAGLPKGDFGKFVGAFAKYQIAAQEADVATYVAEKTKLGTNADVRIKAAETYLGANLKADEAQALGGALISEAGVRALERLIALKSSPTAATGVGASNVHKFDGLHGGDLLDAIRASKAA